ncbi:MAG: hypothetical protein RR842_04845 [Gordonibacter sp.]|uniref:hypothetical protein n=1 Tax=Gordonibacter sp. TaxID=1968902 RepID=UPI002B3856FE|nr:hypothetical protein [Gordonibacter sp.]
MRTYTHTASIKLTDSDYRTLYRSSREAGVTQSQYLRTLIRLPQPAENYDQPRVFLIDGKSIGGIHRELVRWGRHYNQAVHALNTQALFCRRGNPPEYQTFLANLDEVSLKLERIEGGLSSVEYALCDIAHSLVVSGD